jgi:ribonuclease J
VGLQRRLRRELQVEPLIICLVQPAPAGTPAYKGRADAEPDSRPAPRAGRHGGRDGAREVSREIHRNPAAQASTTTTPLSPERELAVASVVASPPASPTTPARREEPEMPANRLRRRRSTAAG